MRIPIDQPEPVERDNDTIPFFAGFGTGIGVLGLIVVVGVGYRIKAKRFK